MQSLETELGGYIRDLREEVTRADLLFQGKQMITLANSLARAERLARLGQYCIVDIADLAA